MVQMHEDNIFQQKNALFKSSFANGVVTCVVVMKCEWEALGCDDIRKKYINNGTDA